MFLVRPISEQERSIARDKNFRFVIGIGADRMHLLGAGLQPARPDHRGGAGGQHDQLREFGRHAVRAVALIT